MAPSWNEAVKPLGTIAYICGRGSSCCATLAPRFHPLSFQLIQGIETLPLRMERICANTQKVVDY